MGDKKRRTIKVDQLARVEGEGALDIVIEEGDVTDVKLSIFEPPRFFEAFLRGRRLEEAPDITARICGICPVAYQMSAVHAMEDALGIRVTGALRALRRLIYCAEWIESHTLHITMLHAPDFLGYPDAIQMAKEHPKAVQRGLQLKKVGNELLRFLGGREVHPINVKVGGFYRVPSTTELAPLRVRLKQAREWALEMVRWVASFSFPDFTPDYTFVALCHPDEYPFNEGKICSSKGLDIAAQEFDHHFTEKHRSHSTALHCLLESGESYLVGPMARYNLNFEHLTPLVQEVAGEVGLDRECRNPFQSIVVRSLEVLQVCDEAVQLIEDYQQPEHSCVPYEPREAVGYGCTEAPRGILYHRYRIDEEGIIREAKIIPPTSQNQTRIEEDLRHFVRQYLESDDATLQWHCEQAIRNYDPCISCSTHFLKLNVVRR